MVRQLLLLPDRGVSLEVDIHDGGLVTGGAGLGTAFNISERPVLVVLHPLAWLGGSMSEPLVVAICRAAKASGLFSKVVRFNMRGAGASTGTRSLLAASVDASDLVVLVRHLLGMPPPSPGGPPMQRSPSLLAAAATRLAPLFRSQSSARGPAPTGCPASAAGPQPQRRRAVLVSYSYGCLVASRALAELRPHVAAMAAVAFPLGNLSRFFLHAGAAWDGFAGPRGASELPRLLCCGDSDQFTSRQQLTEAVDKARRDEAKYASIVNAAAAGTTEAAAAAAGRAGGSPAAAARAATLTAGGGGSAAAPSATDVVTTTPTTTTTMVAIASATGQEVAASGAAPSRPGVAPGVVPGVLDLVWWPGCDHFFFDSTNTAALVAEGLVPPVPAPSGPCSPRREAEDLNYDSDSGEEYDVAARPQPRWVRIQEGLAQFVIRWLATQLEPT